jgi:hypothetical protein
MLFICEQFESLKQLWAEFTSILLELSLLLGCYFARFYHPSLVDLQTIHSYDQEGAMLLSLLEFVVDFIGYFGSQFTVLLGIDLSILKGRIFVSEMMSRWRLFYELLDYDLR